MGLRVALVLAEGNGGTEGGDDEDQQVRALLQALAGVGAAAHVYGPGVARFDGFATILRNVDIPAGPGTGDLGAVWQLRRALSTDLRGEPGEVRSQDVVHALGMRAGLITTLARPSKVPFVVSWRPWSPASGLRGIARRAAAFTVARAADLTLCDSAQLQRQATALGARNVRLRLAVPGAAPGPVRDPATVRAEFGLPAGTPLILAVGALEHSYRHDLLIEAASGWRQLRPAPMVLLAGVGPAYRALAGQAVVARAPVLFIGERDDVADLLAAADLAVVTAAAGVGFVARVLRQGVPLVALDAPEISDLTGPDAVLVPDAAGLDVAVRELLADPPRRAALGEAGQRRAQGWPSPAEVARQVVDDYRELGEMSG